MTFSGNPGEAYPVPKLVAISLGILRAIGMTPKSQSTSFNESLNEFELIVQDMLNETINTADPHGSVDQSVIEYEEIIEQINAVERNWLEGETL